MEKPFKNGSFDLELSNMQPTIRRQFEFKNGDQVSFSVTLPRDDAATLPDLHQRSVRAVIDHLESLIGPR